MSETNRDRDEQDEDLRARFPDPEADARLRTPRGDALPKVPQAEFHRPTLKSAETPGSKNSVLAGLSGGDLRGIGAASTIGITLVASIAIGAGLGWLVDKYLLHSTSTPWGLIVGFLLGVISGFMNLIRVASRLNRDGDG